MAPQLGAIPTGQQHGPTEGQEARHTLLAQGPGKGKTSVSADCLVSESELNAPNYVFNVSTDAGSVVFKLISYLNSPLGPVPPSSLPLTLRRY